MIYCTYQNISGTPNQEKKQPTETNPEITYANEDFKVLTTNMVKDFQKNIIMKH